MPDTVIRKARAERLLREKGVEKEILKMVFQDHFNLPDSTCRHPSPRTEENMQLTTCIIIDLTNAAMQPPGGSMRRQLPKLNFKSF